MSQDACDGSKFDRRTFVKKASFIPAALPIATALASAAAQDDQAKPAPAGPDIIDTNVHLFEWPFRQLKYQRTESLIRKLRRHRITKAWAGSFEAVLHKQLDQVNQRLTEECERSEGMFVPFGSVNPAWPDWQEDLGRCHEQYHMRGVRIYPTYHGYTLDHPGFLQLLDATAQRGMLVQIVMRLEDERVHHVSLNIPLVSASPLVEALKKVPKANVHLINSAGPLLGNNVEALVRETRVMFDIAATEGNGGVGKLIQGTNYSYRGAIPVDRLTFGSHAPFFPCESALMKLFESPLTLEQVQKIMNANARRMMA